MRYADFLTSLVTFRIMSDEDQHFKSHADNSTACGFP